MNTDSSRGNDPGPCNAPPRIRSVDSGGRGCFNTAAGRMVRPGGSGGRRERTAVRAILGTMAVLAWPAAGCNGRGPGPAEPSPEGGAAADAGAAEAVEVEAPPVEGTHCVVEVRRAEAVRVGEESTVVFVVVGRAPWHVNPEYRARLTAVAAEHFAVPATEWRAGGPDRELGDAAQNDEAQLRFEVPVAPAEAGEWPLEFKLKFGLCDSEQSGECKVREKVFCWTWTVAGE